METTQIVKICTALSNKPTYVKVDYDMSIDRIFNEAISTLRNSGKLLDADQLENLYKSHQIFANQIIVEKGFLLSDMKDQFKTQIVGDRQVFILELDLLTSHSGGIKYREGFVSNSSSSSFILQTKNLKPIQKQSVLHYDLMIMLFTSMDPLFCIGYDLSHYDDPLWTIYDDGEKIIGHTSMDNFTFEEWFEYLGISDDDYEIGEDSYFKDDDFF